MAILSYMAVALAAYLLGSIPTGFLVAKARGRDIRTVGSGNMGATNVFRTLGKKAGTIVLFVDALKGYIAVVLATFLFERFNQPDADPENYRIVAAIFAVLGHNFTCWLKFKGGKGIATSAGVYLALAPTAVGIAIAAWIIAFALSRYVSVASIVAAVALPTAVWLTKENLALRLVTTALGVLAIVKHKGNIQRLLKGTESRFGRKPVPQEAAK